MKTFDLFQFYKVRLELVNVRVKSRESILFQFYKVRLEHEDEDETIPYDPNFNSIK